MDEQSMQQQNRAKQPPLRVRPNVATASKQRKTPAEPGLAMLVNVIPRDEDVPGFVRGYN